MAEQSAPKDREDRLGPPDVLLDVPELSVDSIHLELDDLEAHVALEANVLDLVTLSVGVDAHVRNVRLDIKGVEAEVHLKARLDQVLTIVDRVMTTLDRNPDLIEGLSEAVAELGEGTRETLDRTGSAVEDVGHAAPSTLGQSARAAAAGVDGLSPGAVAKKVAKRVARGVRNAAADEASDLRVSAARKAGGRHGQRHMATKEAVRLAKALGVDLADVAGSGRDGRITTRDVRRAEVA